MSYRTFQFGPNGVSNALKRCLQRVWKKFETPVKGFVKRLKGFGRSL